MNQIFLLLQHHLTGLLTNERRPFQVGLKKKKKCLGTLTSTAVLSRDQATSIPVRHCPIWRHSLLLPRQQAKTQKQFVDRCSKSAQDTQTSRILERVHMAWLCKYRAFLLCLLCGQVFHFQDWQTRSRTHSNSTTRL